MEPVLVAAYREMRAAHPHCSVDRILEDPDLRADFLARVGRAAPDRTEFDILHGLNNLRKQRKLPRRRDPKAA